MTKTQKLISAMITVAFVLMGLGGMAAQNASAQSFTPGDTTSALDIAGKAAPNIASTDNDQIFTTIGNIVNILLGLLGIVFFILILYAGFIWMTARGDSAKVQKATTMLTQAVIGIIIILSAFAISNFALNQLIGATNTSNT